MAKDGSNLESGIGLAPGTKVGKYELRERMAMGGQAIVYKAYDSLLDRYVAVKQISSHLAADPKFMDRFRKEAQILARLGAEQPSIVTIHELIEDEHGLFIVMEYVVGNSLEAVIADTDGPAEVKAVLQVLWRLTAALHVVHSAGIIHRDIKPGNIIIKEGLWPTIMDFGVAASVSGQTSMVLGTTKYMAPELFDGGDADGRADMYSLGFVAYELLVGRPKFNEIFADVVRDPRSATVRWMKWHGNRSVHAPAASEVNPDIPESLSDIVARMMAKDPADRFENMESLGRAIKASFSHRASGAATRASRRGRVAKADAAAGDDSASESAAGENGLDEPVFDAEPTAPLPRSSLSPSLSLKTRIILGGIIFCSIIAIGVGYGVRAAREKGAWQERLNRMYAAATGYYKDAQYAQAVEAFDAIIESDQFARTAQAAKASVLYEVARGYVAVESKDWQAAVEAAKFAKTRLNNIQSLPVRDEVSSEWRNRVQEEIDIFERYRLDVQEFEEAMVSAADALAQKQYDLARSRLDSVLRSIAASADQRARYRAINRRIDHDEFLDALGVIVRAGEQMQKQNMLTEAAAKYEEALETLKTHKGRSAVGQAEWTKLSDGLTAKIEGLKNERAYAGAMSLAAEAGRKGDRAAEIEALKKAVAIRPSAGAEHARRISKLELEIQLAKALDLAAKGPPDHAIAALEAYLKRDAGNSRASQALDRLRNSSRFDQLVRQGDAAMSAKQWSMAVDKYKAASRLAGIDNDKDKKRSLDIRIRDGRYRLAMSEGDRFRAKKRYSEALKQYESAIGYKKSAEATVRARIDDMMRDRKYEEFMDNARASLDKKQFTDALRWLRQAGQLKQGAEVDQLVRDTRYSQQYTLGVEAYNRGEFKVARAYFKAAKSVKATPDVQKRIDEAGKKIKEEDQVPPPGD